MPIHLEPPAHRHGGPDGKGWNRLSLNAHMGADHAQCALRPRSFPTLIDSQDTRRARWGGYGPCDQDGRCSTCPRLNRAPDAPSVDADRIEVRIDWRSTSGIFGQQVSSLRPVGVPGFERVSWDDVGRLPGWVVDRRPFRDEQGDGFWLVRAGVTT